jgi:hypothetical protein
VNKIRTVLVLTPGLGQSGQPEAKMAKKILFLNQDVKKVPTLSQNAQQYFNPMSKHLRIF